MQEQLAEAVDCSVEFISLVCEAGYSVSIVSSLTPYQTCYQTCKL